MTGYAAALATALIWAAYPVATRAGVTGDFSPLDLIALRFGVGTLLFLPYLALQHASISRDTWRRGVPLALFQGAGMAALVVCGLQFAPANHAAALGPGVAPAWVVLLGALVFGRRPSLRAAGGAALCAAGVLLLAGWSASTDPRVLLGDAMFVAASGLGALYVLQMRRWNIGTPAGAAIVTFYSALVVVPWHLSSGDGALLAASPAALAWQVLWQGVLIGCVALVTLNHAIERLGPERSSALVALVPALSALLSFVFLGEVPAGPEIAGIVAISAGVLIGAARATAAARPPAAPPRTAPPAGYPVPDSAPGTSQR